MIELTVEQAIERIYDMIFRISSVGDTESGDCEALTLAITALQEREELKRKANCLDIVIEELEFNYNDAAIEISKIINEHMDEE